MAKIKNLFVSHVFEDDPRVKELRNLLKKQGYEVRDSSISKDKPNNAKNPEYIKNDLLAPRIKWSGAVVVIVSSDTHNSDWVNWEIEYAERHDKRIIGVWAHGAQDSDLPEALEKYGNAMVGWQGQSIIDAIEGEDKWLTANGVPRAPKHIDRYECP